MTEVTQRNRSELAHLVPIRTSGLEWASLFQIGAQASTQLQALCAHAYISGISTIHKLFFIFFIFLFCLDPVQEMQTEKQKHQQLMDNYIATAKDKENKVRV